MKDIDPSRTARREMRRLARFGDAPLICFLCNYADPVGLYAVTAGWLEAKGVPRSLFEGDHVVGRAHDPDFIVAICRNCHAEVTEGRFQEGISMRRELDQNAREALRLRSLAMFHQKTADALQRWAAEKFPKEASNAEQ